MKLTQIITLANRATRLDFHVMERSLRATGCALPIRVIPYDQYRFDLPPNSHWYEADELDQWLRANAAHPAMLKYRCVTEANYQFVDTDVIFLRNPEETLAPCSGFITSCGHWHNPDHTLTPLSRSLFQQRSTVWQQRVFNTGQFACDRVLYEPGELQLVATDANWRPVILDWIHNEQPGLNLLVLHADVEVNNLTLPPTRMESTWAGDYPGEYETYWLDERRKPYLIHWAGAAKDTDRPLDALAHSFLSEAERAEWDSLRRGRRMSGRRLHSSLRCHFERWRR